MVLLIYPPAPTTSTSYRNTEGWEMPPLDLGYVAALTPRDWAVKIVDEFVEELNFQEEADLVGITTYTCTAPRAYQISLAFKERGIPVVLCGIHDTLVPEEASRFADSVPVCRPMR